MRSLCALSAGASSRSTFTTTVCGPSFSKSWMPIETFRRKSRMKRRRSMSRLSLAIESDVAWPAGQMLAAVDDQCVAGEGWRLQDEAQGPYQVVDRHADAQRIVGVLLGEPRIGLAAAAQRQAGGYAGHPDPRRQRLGQKLGQALQPDLRQRIGEEIGIEVVEFLIEEIDDHAGPAGGQLARQGLRQQHGRPQVDGHVTVEIVSLGGGRAVELEQRGAVD